MNDEGDRPRSWRRTALLVLCLVAGPPAAFVLLSPLLAGMGYATGWYPAAAIGNAVGLILIGAVIVAVFMAAVFAVVAAVLAFLGTMAATVGSAILHIFSRIR